MGSNKRNGGGHQHQLEAVKRALFGYEAKGKGRGEERRGEQHGSWNCNTCGMFNFEFRRWCKECRLPRGAANAGGKSGRNNERGGGKGKEARAGGASNGDKEGKERGKEGNAEQQKDIKAMRKKVEDLEAENLQLREKQRDPADEKVDEEMENEGVKEDISNIDGLQKAYDALVAQMGNDDAAAQGLRCRLDAARASQRASKPLLVQIQAAQRRSERVAKQLEAAKRSKVDLEKERVHLLAQIDEKLNKEVARIEELSRENDGLCAELGSLHERAKQEKESEAGSNKPVQQQLPKQSEEESIGQAWLQIQSAAAKRVAGPGADPTWEPLVRRAFSQLEAVLAILPKSVDEAPQRSDESKAEVEATAGALEASKTREGSNAPAERSGTDGDEEIDEDDEDGMFGEVDINPMEGETTLQTKKRVGRQIKSIIKAKVK